MTYMLILLGKCLDLSESLGLLSLQFGAFPVDLPDGPLDGSLVLLCFFLWVELRLFVSHIIINLLL